MQSTAPPWLPDDPRMRVIVGCTARRRGHGIRRLPDRWDAHGPLAAVLVETQAEAEEVLRALDHPGRVLALDVERKQEVDLMAVGRAVLRDVVVVPTKPNDATVRSLDVLLTRLLGADLTGLRVAVVGTGNIGFKAALLLAERNAALRVSGRRPEAARLVVDAIASILPEYQQHPPEVSAADDGPFDLLVAAVSADGVVGADWLGRMAPGGLVVDAGIGNLSVPFIAGAADQGLRVVRLDTRFAEAQVLWPAPGFTGEGPAKGVLAGVDIVSGGWIGARGALVVDDVAQPRQVVGVADGRGGLLPSGVHDAATNERIRRVERCISGS